MTRSQLLLCLFVYLTSIVSQGQSFQCTGSPEARLIIGEQTKIIASGGSNLRLRPTTNALLLHVIPENEIIPVMDGPFCAGSYAWWQVDYDGERGWVAEGTGEFYWLAPHNIQRAQIGKVRIEIQPELVTDIQLQRLANPPRSQFVLEGFPVSSNQLVPFIVIFDEIPDTVTIDDLSGKAVAKLEHLEIGSRFVDIFFTEPLQESGEISLIYHYIAFTDDNRFIDAYFPISAPDLPLPYLVPDTDIEAYNQQYFEATALVLEALSPDDFMPTLSDLDGIVRSINIHAPLEDSNVFTFGSGGIHIDYNPLLATGISETLILEGDIPQHIQLTLDDYPSGDALIRIYRTEDIPGSSLATLQQILTRQTDNPPQIPVISQPDIPLFRDNLEYLSFASGEGVRYITGFIEGERLYSFQGLSDDGIYYISALLSVSDDFPGLTLIDAMIASLRIGE